jgi:hypothetical protein
VIFLKAKLGNSILTVQDSLKASSWLWDEMLIDYKAYMAFFPSFICTLSLFKNHFSFAYYWYHPSINTISFFPFQFLAVFYVWAVLLGIFKILPLLILHLPILRPPQGNYSFSLCCLCLFQLVCTNSFIFMSANTYNCQQKLYSLCMSIAYLLLL